jgi:hypothetical protein
MLLEDLRSLETELHTIEARRNRQRMEGCYIQISWNSADQVNDILAPISSTSSDRRAYFQRSAQPTMN